MSAPGIEDVLRESEKEKCGGERKKEPIEPTQDVLPLWAILAVRIAALGDIERDHKPSR
jgi:hypothetical protein